MLIPWFFLEGLLLIPAVVAVFAFLLRMWVFRAFGTFPLDMYLGAIVYPFMGAVAGAVVGFGVSEAFRADVLPGTAYVFAGLGIIVYAGGSIAKERATAEQTPIDPFSVEEWRRDLDYLGRLRRISREDRRELEDKTRELAARGKQACEEARQHRFSAYWRRCRRRVRVLTYLWLAFGVWVAARESSLMHSAWYLVSSLTGSSVILAVWFGWRDERMAKSAEGLAQIGASEQIRQRLQRLPDTPVPSLRQRLAMLISPGSVIPG